MLHEYSTDSSPVKAGAIKLQELVVAHIVAYPVHGGRAAAILNWRGQCRRRGATSHG